MAVTKTDLNSAVNTIVPENLDIDAIPNVKNLN
jgi:hypothetical protein